jgi:hypothetical protein
MGEVLKSDPGHESSLESGSTDALLEELSGLMTAREAGKIDPDGEARIVAIKRQLDDIRTADARQDVQDVEALIADAAPAPVATAREQHRGSERKHPERPEHYDAYHTAESVLTDTAARIQEKMQSLPRRRQEIFHAKVDDVLARWGAVLRTTEQEFNTTMHDLDLKPQQLPADKWRELARVADACNQALQNVLNDVEKERGSSAR